MDQTLMHRIRERAYHIWMKATQARETDDALRIKRLL